MATHTTGEGRAAQRRAKGGQPASPSGGRRRKRTRRVGRVVAGVVAALVLLAGGAGAIWVWQLDGNIKHGKLDTASHPQKGPVIPGALNILVIGSDTRNNAQDTQLGGADVSLPHADVEMLVHISADHSNATVLSIPRDTDIQMPYCQDRGSTYGGQAHAQITNSLNYGPGCTVAAVNQLTHVYINHYMVIDFSGVVNMSDAVGGVQVCVDHNVYDPASHLKLSAGSHDLLGQAALEFLRTRHGFGTGGDVGRTVAQHVFLSALIRKLKSASTLSNPADVFSLAEAASKAFKVDDGLAGVTKLVSLADTLAGVPTDHITFATMPNVQDPYNPNAWVVPGPGAAQLFQAIASDQSLTPGTSPAASPSPSPSPSHTAAATVSPASVPVHVLNGTGITGRASAVRTELANRGYTDTSIGDTAPVTATRIQYSTASPLYGQEARQVASALGLPSSALDPTGTGPAIHVLIGHDLKVGGTAGGGASSASSSSSHVDIKAATADATTENAATTGTCALTNTFPLGSLPPDLASWNGMSVERAYARATAEGIPDSDKTK